MNDSITLANRLQEVLLDGTWIANTNYKAILQTVNYEQAIYKKGTLNTIAALTFHINYYIKGILDVFDGRPLTIKDEFSFDAPLLKTKSAWNKLRQELFTNAERLILVVKQLSDTKLKEVFVKEAYGNYQRNLDGMIEHCYYHLGQLVILKKLQT